MTKSRWALVPLLSLSLFTGCYSQYVVRPGDVEAARANTPPTQRESTYHRALTALLDDGFVPQTMDTGAGYIQAKRRDDVDHDVLAGATAFVTVSPEGQVRVEISGAGLYTSGSAIGKAIAGQQQRILNLILGVPGKV